MPLEDVISLTKRRREDRRADVITVHPRPSGRTGGITFSRPAYNFKRYFYILDMWVYLFSFIPLNLYLAILLYVAISVLLLGELYGVTWLTLSSTSYGWSWLEELQIASLAFKHMRYWSFRSIGSGKQTLYLRWRFLAELSALFPGFIFETHYGCICDLYYLHRSCSWSQRLYGLLFTLCAHCVFSIINLHWRAQY